MIPAELLGSVASSTKDPQMFVLGQKWVDAFCSGPWHMIFLLDPLLCYYQNTNFLFSSAGSGSPLDVVGFVLVLGHLSEPVLMGGPVAGFTNPPPLILQHAPGFDQANGPSSILDTSVLWYF